MRPRSGVRQSAVPLWEFQRYTRRNIVLAQFTLSSAVEAVCIANKALVVAIFALKVLAFLWYCTFGRHDAPKPSPLTVPGVWGDHDNFHVLSIAVAALQSACRAITGALVRCSRTYACACFASQFSQPQ